MTFSFPARCEAQKSHEEVIRDNEYTFYVCDLAVRHRPELCGTFVQSCRFPLPSKDLSFSPERIRAGILAFQ